MNRTLDPMEKATKPVEHRRPWRYRRLGSVLLSYDFFLGVPLGVAAAASTLFSDDVRSSLPGVLVGVAGVGAAVATLVLTSLAVLLSLIHIFNRGRVVVEPGRVEERHRCS